MKIDIDKAFEKYWHEKMSNNEYYQKENFKFIFKAAFELLMPILEKYKKSNEFYGDEYSYTIDDDFGISGGMRSRVVLYGDSDERNECYRYAGSLARQTQKEVNEIIEKINNGT